VWVEVRQNKGWWRLGRIRAGGGLEGQAVGAGEEKKRLEEVMQKKECMDVGT
jgi:hypothetical protein